MTPSPETAPSQLGHTITAAPLGTGWAKTWLFSHSLVHLFRSDECRDFDAGLAAPLPAIDIAAALKLPGKLTMAKNVGVTEGKNKKPLIYHRPI